MMTPLVQTTEALCGHKFPKVGYRSKSEDQGRGVPLRVRPNTSHLVFQSTFLTTEFTMSGSLARCEINTLMAP